MSGTAALAQADATANRVRLLERRLQRRDEALEEQDIALADAHASIRLLKEQEASLLAKLKAAEKRISALSQQSPVPSPRRLADGDEIVSSDAHTAASRTRKALGFRVASPHFSRRSSRSSLSGDELFENINMPLGSAEGNLPEEENQERQLLKEQERRRRHRQESFGESDQFFGGENLRGSNIHPNGDIDGVDGQTSLHGKGARNLTQKYTETVAEIQQRDQEREKMLSDNAKLNATIIELEKDVEDAKMKANIALTEATTERERADHAEAELAEVKSILEATRHDRDIALHPRRSSFNDDDFAEVVDEDVEVQPASYHQEEHSEVEHNAQDSVDTTERDTGGGVTVEKDIVNLKRRGKNDVLRKGVSSPSLSRRLSSELIGAGFSFNASGTPSRLKAAEVETPIAKAAASSSAAAAIKLVSNNRIIMVDKSTQMGNSSNVDSGESNPLSLDACIRKRGVPTEEFEDEDGMALLKRRQRVRRLHHWHALSGSADLLEKNPGAYAFLLRQVVVNPVEAKAIVRDARCTYAVKHAIQITPVKLDGKRISLLGADGTPTKSSLQFASETDKTSKMPGKSSDASSSMEQEILDPFASSLCNILSCFCAMFCVPAVSSGAGLENIDDDDVDGNLIADNSRYVSGLNYVAGYCLVTCKDEEAAYWLFVAIFKRVRGLFEPGMSGSNLVLEVLGRTLDLNLSSLNEFIKSNNVDASFWMLGQLQTLFARSTYPREHTKACWDAFLVSNCALDVLVRIAVAVVECLGPLLRAASGQAAMIELLQKPPVDLLQGELLLELALTYSISEQDEATLRMLAD